MNDLHPHKHAVDRKAREKMNGHKGCVLWLTGLSGSGKSTLANSLEAALFKKGCKTMILDGDNIRHGLNSDLGFSATDRKENIRRLGEIAKLLTENGMIVITSFISPFRKDRDAVRKNMKKGDFIEVFLNCDIKTCIKRDPKGLYKKANSGKIKDFTGISSVYEKPMRPEIELDTAKLSALQCSNILVEYLKKKGDIKR